MSFRDDQHATLARIDALEREIRGLIDENSRLRRKRSPYVLPPRRLLVNANLEAAAAHVDVLARERAALIEENEMIRAGGSVPESTAHEPRRWPLHDDRTTPSDDSALPNLAWVLVLLLVLVAMIANAASH